MPIMARVVYDQQECLTVPKELGKPKDGQLVGTPAEKLCEIAGRTCYDSLGMGRNSAEYHKHILEVGHLSVYEHFHFTFILPWRTGNTTKLDTICVFLNRPGVYVMFMHDSPRVTMNLRALLDWDKHITPGTNFDLSQEIKKQIYMTAKPLAPQILTQDLDAEPFEITTPVHYNELWVSMFMAGSRGFSHEQVRHGDFSAISQRSTRFVDESETEWILHPLIKKYEEENNDLISGHLTGLWEGSKQHCQYVYKQITEKLQDWLVKKGVPSSAARKQARGAARGSLGNGLYTEMIFSASVNQWKNMIRQRCSVHADAEIRSVYVIVLDELKRCHYGDAFNEFELIPCPDGIGEGIK